VVTGQVVVVRLRVVVIGKARSVAVHKKARNKFAVRANGLLDGRGVKDYRPMVISHLGRDGDGLRIGIT
jgi:hypothetical protein